MTNYILQEPDTSPLAFFIVLGSLSGVVFILYMIPPYFWLENKLYIFLSLVPAVIVYIMTIYVVSYGGSDLKILNPGVYLISLSVFLMFFGMAIFVDYGIDLLMAYGKTRIQL